MVQNTDTGVPVAPMAENKQKSGNGLKIATAIACVVAVCGIGFGVYGMMQSSQKDSQISDLKVQIKEDDGTITTIETPEIETTTDNGTTVTITDSLNTKYVFSDSNAPGLNKDTSMTVSSVAYTGIRFLLHLDGSVDANYQWVDWNSYNSEIKNQQRQDDTLTGYIDGRIVDISTGHIGNGTFGEVFFLLDDGTVAYMQEDSILSKKYNIKKLADTNGVVRVYGNLYNQDYAGFVQFDSGKISPIVLDGFDGEDAVLRVE